MKIQTAPAAPLPSTAAVHAHDATPSGALGPLVLGAIGVVFGDIGTSPLYTIKEAFSPHYGLQPDLPTVLGILSLIIWSLLLWIPEVALFGNELFTTATPRLDGSVGLTVLLLSFFVVEAVIAVWAFVVFLKCLGQVQGFSAWKALGNTLLVVPVILLPILLIALAVGAFAG